jgi:hypothetical protein
MNLAKSALVAGGMSLALAVGALAQGAAEPWDLKERNAYVLMMDGTTKVMALNTKGVTMLMKSAKRVPRGTVIFMNNGELYMVNASKMFDRAGNAMFSAGF